MTMYQVMSVQALEEECKRLEAKQHAYAKAGDVLNASVYAGLVVTATMILAARS